MKVPISSNVSVWHQCANTHIAGEYRSNSRVFWTNELFSFTNTSYFCRYTSAGKLLGSGLCIVGMLL